MVGIRDIAKAAGVSISTVSYALNGSPRVTEKTRCKIKTIADEMGYIPNMAGRNLKRQQSGVMGVYLTNYEGSFYGSLLEGITHTLGKNGYELIVCSGEKSHLFLPEKMIDGAIVLDTTFHDKELLQYAQRGHKIIVMDRELHHDNIRQVLLDNKGGATLAIDYLMIKKLNKVYIISGPKGTYDSDVRLQTSINELKRYGVNFEVIDGDFSKESGYQAAQYIASIIQSYPVGIFALNDEMAIGMYDYFQNSHLSIGKEIRLIGFDNSEVSRYIHPRLASIDYSMYKWGSVSADKLLSLLKGKPAENEMIYTTLIRGKSGGEE